jgi:hypothetical protein
LNAHGQPASFQAGLARWEGSNACDVRRTGAQRGPRKSPPLRVRVRRASGQSFARMLSQVRSPFEVADASDLLAQLSAALATEN